MNRCIIIAITFIMLTFFGTPAMADSFFFSTGDPNGLMATASRPASSGKITIESADDFIVTAPTTVISSATFTGLLTGSTSSISRVAIEIYRVFPYDSDIGRTSGPPTFSTQVPTRVNSPADGAFDSRDSAVVGQLSFSTSVLDASFTAANSVLDGIYAKPNQTTGGEGPVTGQEVEFTVTFTTPLSLGANHYFFVPQVQLDNGEFYWLSASMPIVPPGTPFAPDLQSWIRNANLDPDWLRVGTDIVGTGVFNGSFSLTGNAVPLPATLPLLGTGLAALAVWRRSKRSA
jgi:PEP-CTERM motif